MPQPGYVYIVHGIGTAFIKVGKTTDIQRRLEELSHGVPFRLRVLYVELVHDIDNTERSLKARYQAFQSRGEWFELSAEALALWPVVTENVKPLKEQPPALRIVPKKLGMQERIIEVIQKRGPMTARDMQLYLYRVKAADTNAVLPAMLEDGTIQAKHVGKTTIYMLPGTDTEEIAQ